MIWPTKKLGEVAQLVGGYAFKSSDLVNSKQTGYLPIIKIGNLRYNGSLDISDVQYHKFYDGLTKFLIKKNDILVAMTGATVGKVANSEADNLLLNQRVGLIRAIDNIAEQEYLQSILLSRDFYKYCQKTAGGGAQGNISLSQIMEYPVLIPPIYVQKKIVEQLGAIKTVQELNGKQITLADELFQSLLQKDLEQKSKDLEVKRLGEISDCKDGDWILTKDLQTGNEVRLIQLGDIGELDFLDKTRKYISKKRCEKLGCTVLKPKDILLNRMGDPIGIACILHPLPYPAITAVDVTIIRANEKIVNQLFLLYAINSKLIRAQIAAFSKGSTRPRISRKNLEKIKISFPPLKTQRQIVEKLQAVQDYKKKLLGQKQKLQELFASCLNKAMKGDLVN